MKNKKLTGSYYTPEIVATFMVDYLSEKLNNKTSINVLEPSAGDGSFVYSIFRHELLAKKIKSVVAIEKSKIELNKIKLSKKPFTGIKADFLEYQKNNLRKFDIVIGNPPYIKKNLLSKKQIKVCKEIHLEAKLSDTRPKNIWTSFLVRCIGFTAKDGILGFVLPSELLQVKFASELRALIIREFERVEIFTFNELLFNDSKGQDTVLLICERIAEDKGVFYCNINKLTDLKKKTFTLAQNINIRETKWTHHHLTTDEIVLLEKLKNNIKSINYYCNSRAGIVTAANDYFIVNTNTVEKYSLQKFVKQIIQKGVFINGYIELTKKKFQSLVDNSKPSFLIALDNTSNIEEHKKIKEYLEIGKSRKIHTRYKTSMRKKWYEVPNIGSPPEAFFFKRCNEYPKFIKNNAEVLTTDSAYKISMNKGYSITNLIYSFYNSLTLSFAELNGRYYGGGVLELTPNEFKNLPVPYLAIGSKEYKLFVSDFKNKLSIKDICKKNDSLILKSIDEKLNNDDIEAIQNIREKLYKRRIKTN